MTPTRPKVFCIGFHKTGTKSLGAALATLGYRVAGPRGTLDPQIATNALPLALRLAGDFDAFQDNPWPILFKELDAAFPGSRFILTLREPAAWIASVVRHFGHATSPMREWIYGRSAGAPAGNEAIYLARHAAHVAEVRAHFRGTQTRSARNRPHPRRHLGPALRLPRPPRPRRSVPAREPRGRSRGEAASLNLGRARAANAAGWRAPCVRGRAEGAGVRESIHRGPRFARRKNPVFPPRRVARIVGFFRRRRKNVGREGFEPSTKRLKVFCSTD